MVRTQIRIDAKEYARARKHAKSLGISIAEFVRRAIRGQPESNPPWLRYAGIVESGNPSSRVLVDEVVYGSKD